MSLPCPPPRLQEAAAPIAHPCVLTLQGSLRIRRASPAPGDPDGPEVSVEVRDETFSLRLEGTLTEAQDPDGWVAFTFTPDPARPGSGSLEASLSRVDPAGSLQRAFAGRNFRAAEPLVFRARYRGQELSGRGGRMTAEGTLSTAGGAPSRGTYVLTPLPAPGAPLAFSGLSLWALRNAPSGGSFQGRIVYGRPGGPGEVAGRVEVRFDAGRRREVPPPR